MNLTVGSSIPDYLGNENGAKLEGILGKGGMRTVYRAVDSQYEYAVALSPTQNPLDKDTLTKIQHQNIVTHYNYLSYQGEYLTYMQLLHGKSLDKYIENGHNWNTDIVQNQIISPIAESLMYLHENSGVIHRDVKPENIMITLNTSNTITPILFDFNISKKMGANDPLGQKSQTIAGAKAFSFQYTSKEQMQGETTDIRTDVYAFAATALALILKEHHVGWFNRINTDPYSLPELEKQLQTFGYHHNISGALHLALQVERYNRTPTIRDFYTQFKDQNFRIPTLNMPATPSYKPSASIPPIPPTIPITKETVKAPVAANETRISIDEGIKKLSISEIRGAQVYISYNTCDVEIAKQIADILYSVKIKPWFRDGVRRYNDFRLGENGASLVKTLIRSELFYNEGPSTDRTYSDLTSPESSHIILSLISSEKVPVYTVNHGVKLIPQLTKNEFNRERLPYKLNKKLFQLLIDDETIIANPHLLQSKHTFRLWVYEDMEAFKNTVIDLIRPQHHFKWWEI